MTRYARREWRRQAVDRVSQKIAVPPCVAVQNSPAPEIP
jgi:hypothetical protein